MPVPEPANFLEGSLRINREASAAGSLNITFADIAGAILGSLGGLNPNAGSLRMKKMRVTSLVVEQGFTAGLTSGTGAVVPDFIGQLSGNHWAPSDLQKPLRVRFSNLQGSDGEWKRDVSIGGTVAAPTFAGLDGYGQAISSTTVFANLNFDSQGSTGVTWSGDLRFRIAFTDTNLATD